MMFPCGMVISRMRNKAQMTVEYGLNDGEIWIT